MICIFKAAAFLFSSLLCSLTIFNDIPMSDIFAIFEK